MRLWGWGLPGSPSGGRGPGQRTGTWPPLSPWPGAASGLCRGLPRAALNLGRPSLPSHEKQIPCLCKLPSLRYSAVTTENELKRFALLYLINCFSKILQRIKYNRQENDVYFNKSHVQRPSLVLKGSCPGLANPRFTGKDNYHSCFPKQHRTDCQSGHSRERTGREFISHMRLNCQL